MKRLEILDDTFKSGLIQNANMKMAQNSGGQMGLAKK